MGIEKGSMKLSELCKAVPGAELHGEDVDVAALAYHTKDVVPGTVFVALRGLRTDGHFFLKDAVDKGAVAAVVNTPYCDGWPAGKPLVVVPDTRKALAMMAVRFYGDPSSRLRVYGVTGTNGKTTTVFLIQSIMSAAGVKTGVIGTLGCRIGSRVIETDRTTPESLDLQRILSDLLHAGAEAVAMEVSSHALALGRTLGCRFAGAVFTNLTQDHFDFHPSIEDYFHAKSLLFTEYAASAGEQFVSAIGVDSDWGRRLCGMALGRVVTFGASPEAEVRAEDVNFSTDGTSFRLVSPWGSSEVHLKLVGEFNVQNALASAALALGCGIGIDAVKAGLEEVGGVPGRFERVDRGQPFTVIVDYAHTPDGLEKLLRAALRLCGGRLLVVFGCGGDRDPGKRPIMGEIAARMSDLVVVTSDNPRSEDPELIIDAVIAGVPEELRDKVIRDSDRRSAIFRAVRLARPGDVVVIAGKGHEDYQILGNTKIHFDDREVAAEALDAVLYAG